MYKACRSFQLFILVLWYLSFHYFSLMYLADVISNCGYYYTESIHAYLDLHLQPLAQAVISYDKDTNNFLNKLRSLPKLPDNILLCTVDVLGFSPVVPHKENQSAVRN